MGTDIHGVWQAKINGSWKDISSNYAQNRHYLLFAWLGNVRNGYGFAGCLTHEAIKPLSDYRGYPNDFIVNNDDHLISSIEIMDHIKQEYYSEGDDLVIWMGDHSHSWLLGEEIVNVNLPIIKKTGIISISDYFLWDKVSQPKNWCGGISGPKIKVNVPSKINEETSHVSVTWNYDLKLEFSYFIQEVKRLIAIWKEIRFVFGFDS